MNLHSVTAGIAAGISNEPQSPPRPASPSGAATSLLPEPSVLLAGDMGAQIAALAVQQGETQQHIDTVATEQEDAVENQADAAQVATLHDEASTMRAGAWESGVLQMSAGACAIGSAGASIDAKVGSTRAAVSGILKGGSEGLMGGGSLADGLSKAAATDSQALATGQKALSDAAQRAGDMDRDAQKSASAFVQAAVDFYREYETTKNQAQAAAVHGA